jgi:hypothetical protein
MFTPDRSFQSVCNPKCAIQYAKDKAIIARDKKLRSEIKTAREALKTRSDHLKDAQTDFNAFIRERDRLELCISCGRNHNGQYHAGHYRSVGAAPHLRFNEDNCHKQCSVCNNHKSGNAIEYRINLVKKIGVDRVEAIECNNEPAKLTIDQIKEIRKAYKKKLKEIKET